MKPEKWVYNVALLPFLLFGICNSTDTDTITPNQSIKDGEILVSNGKTFALGFFSPGNGSSSTTTTTRSRYVGIWYNKIWEQTVVWVANRDNPINGKSGVISINQDGNLAIYDNTRNVSLWQTNVSAAEMATSSSYYSARLLDSGNLVLFQGGGGGVVAWQSFDYPTHTLLPDMKLGRDRRTGLDRFLTSWKSRDDPGTGQYSFRMDPSTLPQLVLYKGSVRFWQISAWIWNTRTGNFTNFAFNFSRVDNREEVSMAYVQINATILSTFFVNEFGRIKMDTWLEGEGGGGRGKWVGFYTAPTERCDSYGRCGVYGYCDDENKGEAEFECTCLPGYEPKSAKEWSLRDASSGCVKKRATLSMCRNGEGFVKVESAKILDRSKGRVEKKLNMQQCEEECLRNCSCLAYTTGDGGNCFTWYGSLIDVRTSRNGRLFVRVDADELLAQRLKKKSRRFHGKKMAIVVPSVVVITVVIISLVCSLIMKKTRKDAKFDIQASDEGKLELPIFDMNTIATATNEFSDTNKIGEGGFGPVYKGQLSIGNHIAIKRLSASSKQGVDEFKNEVLLIAKLQHRNLVRLLGCCIHGEERMLIYEYMPNGSLDSFIFGLENKSKLLTWRMRLDIIVGIARGVLYLHQDSRLRIIHRDLKVSNVLLDGEMNPKISDFGLARAFGGDQSLAKTRRVVGTYGYMSPEYTIDGLFSMKSDVFSYGVIVLEIMSGKKNRMFHHPDHDLNLLGHAWNLWTEGKAYELIDPLVEGSLPTLKVLRCIHVGLLCVQKCPEDRPTMSSVLVMLVSETAMLPQPKQPGFYVERSSIETRDHPLILSTTSINEVTMTHLEAR